MIKTKLCPFIASLWLFFTTAYGVSQSLSNAPSPCSPMMNRPWLGQWIDDICKVASPYHQSGVHETHDDVPPANPTFTIDAPYRRFRQQFESGQQKLALSQARLYLTQYPNDGDVRLVLGQMYFNMKEYDKARYEELEVIKQTPNYIDALLILINADIQLNHYQDALFFADFGLLFNPFQLDLLKQRQTILAKQDKSQPIKHPSSLPSVLYTLPNPSSPSLPYYLQLKQLYTGGHIDLAIQRAFIYLKQNPTDVDVRLTLAEFYFYKKDYGQAKKELVRVLLQVPTYQDALIVLANIELVLHQRKKALAMINVGLLFNPFDIDLRKKQQDIKYLLVNRSIKVITARNTFKNSNVKPIPPSKGVHYKNEVGLFQQNYYISDKKQVWDYSTIYYGREGNVGKIYGKVNYANRLANQGVQAEIEALPKLNKYTYVDLQATYANQPILFANYSYGGELYVATPKTVDWSLGGRYYYIESLHQYSLFTGSIAKQLKNDRLTYRPTFFQPNSGKNSFLNQFDYRHFIEEPNFYWGIMVGVGSSPDLADLTTIDFLVTQNKIISPYINIALLNERLLLNASLYYQHQVFDIPLIRNWIGGTLKLAWKY